MSKIKNYDFNNVSNVDNDKTLERMKAGNRLQRENFLFAHEQFIGKAVSSVLGLQTTEKNCNEFNVGHFAFNYSIDKYDKKNYNGFLTYSEQMIKEWVREYNSHDWEQIRTQIVLLKHKMWEFGITLEKLESETPNNIQSIKFAIHLAKVIIANEPIFKTFNLKSKLSEEEFASINKFFSKQIKKNRKYVIAIILILMSDLEILKNCLKNVEGETHLMGQVGVVLECSRDVTVFLTSQGRFVVSKNFDEAYLGQKVYINNYKNLGSKIIKYSILAASVSLVAVLAFVSINYVTLNGNEKGTADNRKAITDSNSNSSKNVLNEDTKTSAILNSSTKPNDVKTVAAKVSSVEQVNAEPTDNKQDVIETTITPVPENPDNQNKFIGKPAGNTVKSDKSSVKLSYTPLPKPTQPVLKSTPLNMQDKILPGKKLLNIPVPTGYATVIATDVPGVPKLSSDLYEVNVGQDYTVTMHMKGGNNGTEWVLYENGKAVSKLHYPDNTPNEQAVMRLITAKSPGTYTYRCELVNSFGSTSSTEISVTVK